MEKRSLAELLAEFDRQDELLEDPEYDPRQVFGELQDEIDQVQALIARMKFQGDFLKAQADELLKRAKRCYANQERTEAEVMMRMREREFQRLPGLQWNVERRRAAIPAVILLNGAAEPSVEDFIKRPGLVRQIPAKFEWDKANLKLALQAERPDVQQIARLEYSERLAWQRKIPVP